MKLSQKQLHLLMAVGAGNPDGSLLDMDQLLEVLAYRTTKQSIQFSIRALIAKGLMEKRGRVCRRGRVRVTFGLTGEGRMYVTPAGAPPSKVEDDDDEEWEPIPVALP